MMLRKNLIFPAPAKQRKHSPSLNAEGKEGGGGVREQYAGQCADWVPTDSETTQQHYKTILIQKVKAFEYNCN